MCYRMRRHRHLLYIPLDSPSSCNTRNTCNTCNTCPLDTTPPPPQHHYLLHLLAFARSRRRASAGSSRPRALFLCVLVKQRSYADVCWRVLTYADIC
jgi:hypothetical protein